MTKTLFFLGILLAATGLLSPPFALAAGLVYGLVLTHPLREESTNLSRFLLKASVVGLGFGMNLKELVKTGSSGFVYTAVGITFALIVGTVLGRALRVGKTQSFLICAGTAICGGSAIAAIGPVVNANDEEMAASLGTIFVLNSVALFLFPLVGWRLHLTQTEFGLWSALAIHDTSSVVGAAAKYGPAALAIATTVKLARALWIVPVTLGTAVAEKSKARIQWPGFIALFAAAAMLNSLLPRLHPLFLELSTLGRLGLSVTLFLIGTGISRKVLQRVGVRPMMQGLVLWIIVATLSLWAIRSGLIAL
jgi:uncharacterized integral membrane protein (TIGR00698 family)